MSQQEIVDFLRRYQRGWFNTAQLSDALKISRASINNSLGSMRKREEVNTKMVKLKHRGRYGSEFLKDVPFYSFKD